MPTPPMPVRRAGVRTVVYRAIATLTYSPELPASIRLTQTSPVTQEALLRTLDLSRGRNGVWPQTRDQEFQASKCARQRAH
jgi:hypothetical protein